MTLTPVLETNGEIMTALTHAQGRLVKSEFHGFRGTQLDLRFPIIFGLCMHKSQISCKVSGKQLVIYVIISYV